MWKADTTMIYTTYKVYYFSYKPTQVRIIINLFNGSVIVSPWYVDTKKISLCNVVWNEFSGCSLMYSLDIHRTQLKYRHCDIWWRQYCSQRQPQLRFDLSWGDVMHLNSSIKFSRNIYWGDRSKTLFFRLYLHFYP